jgi:hypothetical protein
MRARVLTRDNTLTDLTDFWFDPHNTTPWSFPEENVHYVGTIKTTPYVSRRLNQHGAPERTPEGQPRWALWTTVSTEGEDRGLRIQRNARARGFDGRATEANLRRWAEMWEVGGTIDVCWTRAPDGSRSYQCRYTAPDQ